MRRTHSSFAHPGGKNEKRKHFPIRHAFSHGMSISIQFRPRILAFIHFPHIHLREQYSSPSGYGIFSSLSPAQCMRAMQACALLKGEFCFYQTSKCSKPKTFFAIIFWKFLPLFAVLNVFWQVNSPLSSRFQSTYVYICIYCMCICKCTWDISQKKISTAKYLQQYSFFLLWSQVTSNNIRDNSCCVCGLLCLLLFHVATWKEKDTT